jgi:sulfur carrier protein ThiS
MGMSEEGLVEIHLQLHSILRDLLPSELEGKTVLQIEEGATLTDLLQELDITRKVVISVNDLHETNHQRQLQDGDKVMLFTSISGG